MDGDTEDTPQAGKDLVHDLWVSVGAELSGYDGLPDVCGGEKKQTEPLKTPG